MNNVQNREFDIIPVIRYAKSMPGSLYFGEIRPVSVCGRFYYYESESETFLQYRKGKILKGFNKTDIYHKIYLEMKVRNECLASEMKQEYMEVIKQHTGRRVELHLSGLRKDLKYTSYEAYIILDVEYADGSGDIPNQGTDTFYTVNELGMYATEDEFD